MKAHRCLRCLPLLAISASFASAATNQYWNVGGAVGDGIWGTGPGDKNWNLAAGALSGNTTWQDPTDNIAVFEDTSGGTVTVFDPVQTNGLSQTGANYTLDAGVITLVSDATPTAPSINVQTGTLTVNSVLAGTSGLNKTGAANLLLTNANPFTGPTAINAGTLTLTGSFASTIVGIAGGASLTDVNGGLAPATVLTNAGTLAINAAETIASLTNNAGTVNGTGILTVTGATIFTGGTLNLTGTATNTPITIGALATLIDANGGLAPATVLTNAGTLNLRAADTVASYTQNGTGSLIGLGRLTAAQGATLNGGAVSTSLWGDVVSTGDVLITGPIGGGTLAVNGGLLTLNGDSSHSIVTIATNAGMGASAGRLGFQETLTNAGTLTLTGRNSIRSYVQEHGGTLAGDFELAANSATLNGGTIAGILGGAVTSTGNVLVSGSIDGRVLNVTGGTLTLTGTATLGLSIGIAAGARLLDASGGLDGNVTNAGILTINAADTIGSLTNTAGTVNGTGTLTVTGPTIFTGGTLAAPLTLNGNGGGSFTNATIAGFFNGNTISSGNTLIPGSVGGGSLDVTGGTLTLTGSLSSPVANIASGAWLKDYSGGLADTTAVNNAGLLIMGAADTVATYHSSGALVGPEILSTISASLTNGADIVGNLQATDLSTHDQVTIRGTVTADFTRIATGTLWLTTELWGVVVPPGFVFDQATMSGASPGVLNSATVDIASGATLSDRSGGLVATTILTNSGTLELVSDDLIHTYISNGGTLSIAQRLVPSGRSARSVDSSWARSDPAAAAAWLQASGSFSAFGGATLFATTATLNDGSVVAAGLNAGTLTSTGAVSVTGSATANSFNIASGVLTNTGILTATHLNLGAGATLVANGIQAYSLLTTSGPGAGTWQGNLINPTTVAPGGTGATGTLAVTGNFTNAPAGTLKLDLSAGARDLVTVGGTATFGGALDLNQLSAIAPFVPVQVVAAGAYAGNFTTLTENLDGAAWFNPSAGTVMSLVFPPAAGGTLWGTTTNQTAVWVSLYDDVIDPSVANVAALPGGGYHITSGIADANNPDLLNALSASFGPGGLNAAVLDRLSPEVYIGFQDYAVQATRSHQRAALNAPTLGFIQAPQRSQAKGGKATLPAPAAANPWEYFAAVDYFNVETDNSPNRADYGIDGFGLIAGARTALSDSIRVGGYVAADDGSVDGALMDGDASGWSLGLFAKALVHAATHTLITGGISYGQYTFDGTRGSLIATGGGWTPAGAGFSGVDSDALEFYLGASSVAYQTEGFRLIPSIGLRYVCGGMNGFAEAAGVPGSPIALVVDEDAYHSTLAELSLRAEADLTAGITAHGMVGFSAAINDDPAVLTAHFASGSRPLRASAPGLDEDAIFIGLGATWRVRDNLGLGLNWRADFRSDADMENTVGLSTSIQF